MFIVKVRRDGQITLPIRIRKALGIKSGDFVEVELAAENAIVIKLKEIVDMFQIFSKMFSPFPKGGRGI